MISMNRPRVAACATGLAVALSLSACAESESSSQSTGEGVKVGATKADYQKAFEQVDAITINAQSATPKGSVAGLDFDQYVESVEEWSGGKITFNVAYSSSVAAPEDADNALADGRLDFAKVIPSYEPSDFPVSAALSSSSVLGDLSLIEGTLSSGMWMRELALNSKDYIAEYEDKGMKVVDPASFTGTAMVFCPKPYDTLSSFKGASIASGSASWSGQLKALGSSPVSLPFTETFEAVQRGVIDCSMTSVSGALASGVGEVAPHVTYDNEVRSTANPSVFAYGLDAWESWPLVVQQLLWDRTIVLMDGNLIKTFDSFSDVSKLLQKHKGSVVPFDAQSRTALAAAQDDLVSELEKAPGLSDPKAWVESARKMAGQWEGVPAELGFSNEASLAEFATWYESAKVDLTALVERAYDKVYAPGRPG